MLQQELSPPAPSRAPDVATVDAVARELLTLGWLVRLQRSAGGQAPLLLVSRSGFDATPATVHVLSHHHVAIEIHPGALVDVDDLGQLHHRLQTFTAQPPAGLPRTAASSLRYS